MIYQQNIEMLCIARQLEFSGVIPAYVLYYINVVRLPLRPYAKLKTVVSRSREHFKYFKHMFTLIRLFKYGRVWWHMPFWLTF